MTDSTKTERRPNYRIYDRTGGGSTEHIYADSLDDAIEQGRDWIEAGDWSGGDLDDEDGGRTYRTIELECEVGPIFYVPSEDAPSDMPTLAGYGLVREHDGTLSTTVLPADLAADWPAIQREAQDTGHCTVALGGVDADGDHVVEISPSATWPTEESTGRENDRRDCSGAHSDAQPECEQGGGDDEHGHDWRLPHSLVGGLKENPGVWSQGGTRTTSAYVCARCGSYKTVRDPGSQRNPGEALESCTIRPRDADSEAWLRRIHEDEGWLPGWLAEMLGDDMATREQHAQACRDLAVEAQDVSHGIHEAAVRIAAEIDAGELSWTDAAECLANLRARLEEAAAEEA